MTPLRIIRRFLGSHSQRELARAESYLASIRRKEAELKALSDDACTAQARALRERANGGPALDECIVDAMALASLAAERKLGLRPFDVQLVGALVLHRGGIAEMKTGEGKTLVAALVASLNALAGKGVHVVTVNDYLASRDAEWMLPIFASLGLSVGVITETLPSDGKRTDRRAAYAADVTYVTNHELVFDYLRDQIATSADEVVGREFHFALVDEADFLLLDEARTPLIISGPAAEDVSLCKEACGMLGRMEEGKHYEVEHKTKQAFFLDAAYDVIEKKLGIGNLADGGHEAWRHALHSALLAKAVYERDVDYVVDEGSIVIVDEFTGRLTPEKRYADGLHQALEAKEGVTIQEEDITLAKITYQNYFRMYPKLSGMTGTAMTEKEELSTIYGLGTVAVPTHRPVLRLDGEDRVFRTEKEKLEAIAAEVERERAGGRPVLIGTVSVKDSEKVSKLLEARGIAHEVLNAKHHKEEAAIVAQAGRSGAVTVATNMAGRGTDILLGGNPLGAIGTKRDGNAPKADHWEEDRNAVVRAGGLAVIGTELHESVRLDNQLRGRAGRQGDPGSSIFFLSLDDTIYRKFGKTALPELRAGLRDHPPGEPVRDRGILKNLRELRKKVEVENRAIRREVFRYDLVIDEQRRSVHAWRRRILGCPAEGARALVEDLVRDFLGDGELSEEENEMIAKLDAVEKTVGADFPAAALAVILGTVDDLWTEHLNALEQLDEGIGLRGYAEKDPLVEYRREAARLFGELGPFIRRNALVRLLALAPAGKRSPKRTSQRTRRRTRKG